MRKPSSDTDAPTAEAARATPRRKFVFFGALAAASFLPSVARAQGKDRKRRIAEPGGRAPVDGIIVGQPTEDIPAFAEWDTGGLTRLVRRATMGITQAEVTRVNQLGWNGYINYQLNYTRIDDSVVENTIAQKYPLMALSGSALVAADAGQVQNQLRESTIYRSAFSQRQLHARMVEFWTDHFNQDLDKVANLLVADQRDVIRKYAMATFPQLLKASAHSPSMMLYLDQNQSRSGAPNQNYAREIMELHTLGVDGGYTQDDVAELSRVLTGWTINNAGAFVFNANLHDTGTKTVLGHTIAGIAGANGIQEGEQMLDILVNHPSTARFIATKMLKWMVTPSPTDSQVGAIAAVYRATGGDIRSMLRAMLNDAWITAAPMKLKRPFHLAVSTLRSVNPNVTSASFINTQAATMGHQSFAWDTPDGYPDKVEYWAGNLLPRWSFGGLLSLQNSLSSIVVDPAPYQANAQAAVDLLDQNFFGGEMPAATRTALITFGGTGALSTTRARDMISLAIGANAFQWY